MAGFWGGIQIFFILDLGVSPSVFRGFFGIFSVPVLGAEVVLPRKENEGRCLLWGAGAGRRHLPPAWAAPACSPARKAPVSCVPRSTKDCGDTGRLVSPQPE